ncbi:MAG TPA: amino acid deaminase/aldolase [Chitinophagales bacterium]|jgi:D-serine deaminase-like pyridoxal phosphate-dependent protein|nr:amino acid deaminase/aldolase [Chitinophagales bacterium]
MSKNNYNYYNSIFKNQQLPLAFCDLDLLDKNCRDIAHRTKGKNQTIRIASKSIRCTAILKRILASDPIYKGIMCFTGNEALFLIEQGFDDLLLGYPIVNEMEIKQICEATKSGKKIKLMVDCEAHLLLINTIAQQVGVVQPLCIDVDMSTAFPGIHFGVMRSPINSIEKGKQLIDKFEKFKNISLTALMGYEAQIAGLGEKNPANGIKNYLIPTLKRLSNLDYSKRRKAIVQYIESKNIKLDLVNAGGTGSIESSKQENWVTEITVGSGFYSPALFDYYSHFKHEPAVGFAVQIVRKPKENIYTCLGGGYIASGTAGIDKIPKPYLPNGIKLTENEACGEVQTPCVYNGNEKLNIGDTILFRHSKAGEICERFNELQLISNGKIIESVPTYRGQGKCFL